tara:strand:- start:18 stop:719 length:702 start_codon:yes stop_codon:yes gene_type:complete
MPKLKILIKGETINLCLPTLKFAKGDVWYKWLNNKIIIKNLSNQYRKLNNTKKKQEKFFLANKNVRVLLVISTKNHIHKGIVSLSNINKNQRTCDIALISDPTIEPDLTPFAGLEAIALMTTYAFDKMNMKKINGAGNLNLKKWQQRMELFGYQFNFFEKNLEKIKYKKKLDYVVSCNYEDYKFLIKKRGELWDGLAKMTLRIGKLPKMSFLDMYMSLINNKKIKYYSKIFKI